MAAKPIDKVVLHPPNSPVVEFEVGRYGVTSIDVSTPGGTPMVTIYKDRDPVCKSVGIPFTMEYRRVPDHA